MTLEEANEIANLAYDKYIVEARAADKFLKKNIARHDELKSKVLDSNLPDNIKKKKLKEIRNKLREKVGVGTGFKSEEYNMGNKKQPLGNDRITDYIRNYEIFPRDEPLKNREPGKYLKMQKEKRLIDNEIDNF